MATRAPKPTKTGLAPASSTGNALVNWQAEMEKDARAAEVMEQNSGGGSFFSVKSGQLSFDGTPLPGNQMAVVIVDSIFEHVFYEGKFNPDNPSPPTCFAFGRDSEDAMVPHNTVFEHKQEQNPTCKGCPQSEWGSAETGRGKACRQIRRLGVVAGGQFDRDGKFVQNDELNGALGFLKIPVTSVKGYAGFVKQVAGALNRPPYGIFTKVAVVPDAKNQFAVTFTPIGPVPDELMQEVMARRTEAKALIDSPYNLDMEQPAAAPARGRAPAKPAARGRKF